MGTISTHSQSISASAGGTITTGSWFSATDQVAKVYINTIRLGFNTKLTSNTLNHTDRLRFDLKVNSAAATTPATIAQFVYWQWRGTQHAPTYGFANTTGDINLNLVGGCESLVVPYDIGYVATATLDQGIADTTAGYHLIVHDNNVFAGAGAVQVRVYADNPGLPASTTPHWVMVALSKYYVPEYFYLNKGDTLTFNGDNLIGNALFHFTVVSEGN